MNPFTAGAGTKCKFTDSHLWDVLLVHQNVFELEVSVCDSISVAVLHTIQDSSEDLPGHLLSHAFSLLHKVKKLSSRDVLHCNSKVLLVLEALIQGDDVLLATEGLHVGHFSTDSVALLVILQRTLADELESHLEWTRKRQDEHSLLA